MKRWPLAAAGWHRPFYHCRFGLIFSIASINILDVISLFIDGLLIKSGLLSDRPLLLSNRPMVK